jgi:hypothetical protein
MKEPPSFAARFAEKLSKYESFLGWAQKDFVYYTGIDRQTRGGWPSSKRPVTREQINCIAAALAAAQDRKSLLEEKDKAKKEKEKSKSEYYKDYGSLMVRIKKQESGYAEIEGEIKRTKKFLSQSDQEAQDYYSQLLDESCDRWLQRALAAKGNLANTFPLEEDIVIGGTSSLERILSDLLQAAGLSPQLNQSPSLAARLGPTPSKDRILRIGWFDWPGFTTLPEVMMEDDAPKSHYKSLSAQITAKVVSLLDVPVENIHHVHLELEDLRKPGLSTHVDLVEPIINTPSRNLLFNTSVPFEELDIGLIVLMRRDTLHFLRETMQTKYGDEADFPEEEYEDHFCKGGQDAQTWALRALSHAEKDDPAFTPLYVPNSTPDIIRSLVLDKLGTDSAEAVKLNHVQRQDIRDALRLLSESHDTPGAPHYLFFTDSLTAAAVRKQKDDWKKLAALSLDRLGDFSLSLVMATPDHDESGVLMNAVSEAVRVINKSLFVRSNANGLEMLSLPSKKPDLKRNKIKPDPALRQLEQDNQLPS